MPFPTSNAMHQSQPLTDDSVLAMQEDSKFILRQLGPFVSVKQQKNTYYVYDQGDWNRMEIARRGSSEESAGSGWRLSTGNYSCDRWAVHKDTDLTEAANADQAVADTDGDAIDFLAGQGRILGDYIFGTEVFAPSKWTTDLDGTAGAVTDGVNFKQFDDSAGDPQATKLLYDSYLDGLCGFTANVFVAGAVAHQKILTNAAVRAAIHVTDMMGPDVIKQKLANYLGVEKYMVGSAYRTTSAEGATKAVSYILDSKACWMGYVNPEKGLKKMTAFRTFAFDDGGRATDGVVTSVMEVPLKKSVRHEIECFWDVKIINADAGVLFDAAVA